MKDCNLHKTHTNAGHRCWTKEELQIITEHYEHKPNEEIQQILLQKNCHRTIGSIYQAGASLGLKKSKEYYEKHNAGRFNKLSDCGKRYRYKKGNVPPNKGKKWQEFMSDESIRNCQKTQFKKGNLPHNTKFDGYVRERKDKNGVYYKYIRVSLGKWKLLQRVVYEQNIGKIPQGFIVIFKDGNTMNVVPNNLEAISRAEHARRNQNKFLNLHPELKQSKKLINKITKKIKSYDKQQHT